MNAEQKIFSEKVDKKAFDKTHRKIINFNIGKYNSKVPIGKLQYSNIELARKRASHYKYQAINELDKHLIEFEMNFTNRGGKVIWAENAEQASNEVLKILQSKEAKKIVKSKSMITEEIELNELLEKNGIESLETDLGEYIVQLAGEKPYHIITPVMHKSKEIIAELFNKLFDTPIDSTPEYLTNFVREQLREKFVNADAGITGANFIVAKEGAIALTENEGNGMMSFSFPKVHIAIAGIEKVIPSMEALDTIWPLLSTMGTGQNITVYNSLIFGPKKKDEFDGPEEMYVILVNNGRTNLLAKEKQRVALTCIRCGACLNGCPVYRTIGGHAYGTVYSGPIGSVITPHLKGFNYKHLSYASSLCGKCTEVCPVKIDLHKLLLQNRNDAVFGKHTNFADRMTMFGWKKIMLNRWMIDFFGGGMKNVFLKTFFKKPWGQRRTLPKVQPKSFRQQWKTRSKAR